MEDEECHEGDQSHGEQDDVVARTNSAAPSNGV